MGYVIKYAVVWEEEDGDFEVASLCDSMEDAEEFIQDMKEEGYE